MVRIVALLLLAAPLSGQQLWTVDDDGPADFTSVQAAVDAASDGDVLLVRSGSYSPLNIVGKSLTVQGEGAPLVITVEDEIAPVRISALKPDQAVVVRGLRLSGAFPVFNAAPAFDLEACRGAVLFEDCHVVNPPGDAAAIRTCDSVTFVTCSLSTRPSTPWFWGSAGPLIELFVYFGMVANHSNVFLYACNVQGGAGSPYIQFIASQSNATSGTNGIWLQGSTLLASGCAIVGGDGGSTPGGLFIFPGSGGNGIYLGPSASDVPSSAHVVDCELTGGSHGTDGGSSTTPFAFVVDGAPFVALEGSTLTELPGLARSFRPASPVVAGGLLDLHFEGEPGDQVLVFASLAFQPALSFADIGLALHVAAPWTVLSFGALPASGVLDGAFPLPSLPDLPGYEHILFTSQALFVGADGFYDGGPGTVLILSDSL